MKHNCFAVKELLGDPGKCAFLGMEYVDYKLPDAIPSAIYKEMYRMTLLKNCRAMQNYFKDRDPDLPEPVIEPFVYPRD